MLTIKQPYLEEYGNTSRLICDIAVNGKIRQIWFEVSKEYGKYLCFERGDAYVVGLLNWAMQRNHNIVCEVPVSETLIYNINRYLIPSLVKYGKNLNAIKIDAPLISEPMKNEGGVGTGLSCGVDSFHAIAKHTDTQYKSHNLTHLCINNVGAFNDCYKEYGKERVKQERYTVSKKVADKLGLPLIITDSNFADVFPQNHLKTHTYSSLFAVYCLQKLWSVYYYGSSGYDFNKFTLKDNDTHDSAYYELLSLPCFSTSSLKIYSEGGAENRIEKTAAIVDFEPAQKFLHVCLRKSNNCGVCPKCRRTLLTLDALNKLDEFSAVFDIEYYRQNRREYLLWLYDMHLQNDLMNEPVYHMLKDDISLSIKCEFRIKTFMSWLRRGLFSIEQSERHKTISILFIKIKYKN